MDEPAWLSVRSGTELDVWTTEVVLTGCSGGVGLGLDDDNCVTEVVPGLPAGLSSRIAVGDRVVSVDGQPLGGRKLQTIIHPRERHVFEVEKHGMKPLEAFTLQKRRLSRGQSGRAQVDPADHRRRSSVQSAGRRHSSAPPGGRRRSSVQPRQMLEVHDEIGRAIQDAEAELHRRRSTLHAAGAAIVGNEGVQHETIAEEDETPAAAEFVEWCAAHAAGCPP